MVIKVNSKVPLEKIITIQGDAYPLINDDPSKNRLIHLQLRRYSGCLMCNTHLKNFSKGLEELSQHGILELVVFQSDANIIYANQIPLQWASKYKFVADPGRQIYKAFGAERSIWALISLKVIKIAREAAKEFAFKDKGDETGKTQRPMDLLIDPVSGVVVDLYYGKHAYDQWSFKQVLSAAERYRNTVKK